VPVTKIVIDDAHGNRVEVDTDCELDTARRAARKLYDHIKATPAPRSTGPASGGQQIGFRSDAGDFAWLRYGEQPPVKA
jgi:hypothetical protein